MASDFSDIERLEQDIRDAAQGFARFAEAFLDRAGSVIGAQSVQEYMRDAKGQGRRRASDSGPLRIRSGALAQAVARADRQTGGYERIEQIADTTFRLIKGINPSAIPYAGIHEHGGRIKITPRMRSYFWAQWFETEDSMWKALALTKKTHITIPERAYLDPAVRDVLPRLQEMAGDMAVQYLTEALSGGTAQ